METGTKRTDASGKIARLYLLGPFRLLDIQGRDCTPKGSLRRALLAILALSLHGIKARTKLQDMLWSGSDQELGSQSLRTALSSLKRELSVFPESLLAADHQAVRLDVSKLWIDVFAYAEAAGARLLRRDYGTELPDLLEGLNIRASQDEVFEDWLRDERRHWGEKLEALLARSDDDDAADEPPPDPAAAVRTPVAYAGKLFIDLPTARPPLSVGLLPTIAVVQSSQAAFLGDAILDWIATGLRDFLMAEIYDYRDGRKAQSETADGLGPGLLLQAKVFEQAERLMFTLLVYRTSRQKLEWSWTAELPLAVDFSPESDGVMAFVNQAIDRICLTYEATPDEHLTGGTAFHALNTMFTLEPDALRSVRLMLQRASELAPDPIHLSLQAYLNTFRVGEHWEEYDRSVIEDTRHLVNGVMAANPFNALALALTGHACGYILHDYTMAEDLLGSATAINPNLAICWDHLALNHLYSGRLDEARRASEMAIRIGRFSPLRFTYETTVCMVATLSGDYATAVRLGERALAHRPNFGAALRYTAVSFGHLGEQDVAARLVSRIRVMAPDFSHDWVVRDRLAVADESAKSRLLVGLQKAGA